MPRPADPLASYEARSYWAATMPSLPDRRGRPLPDAAEVVVVGGGYTGLSAARSLAAAGVAVVLLEAESLGFGASTRNGGMAHPGYKWGPRALVARHGAELGGALYRDTQAGFDWLRALVRDEAIDCEWDERGQLTLASAPGDMAKLAATRDGYTEAGVETRLVPREQLREEIGTDAYFGGLAAGNAAGVHPGRLLAGLAAAADRSGASLHEGVRARAIRLGSDRRHLVETNAGTIRAREVVIATNGYTDGVAPALRRRVIPIGSYIIVTDPLDEEVAREVAPTGRLFYDTKNFLFYWRLTADRRMLFGGRASFLPTSIERTARILQRGLATVHPQLATTRVAYAWGGKVAFTMDRMPHVGRTPDGVTYALGYCGTGVVMSSWLGSRLAVWLGGGEAPLLARLPFPLVPAPYEGRPWFLPFVGEWYRLQDRRARRAGIRPG